MKVSSEQLHHFPEIHPIGNQLKEIDRKVESRRKLEIIKSNRTKTIELTLNSKL